MTAFTKEWSKQNILIEEMEEESVDTSSEGDFDFDWWREGGEWPWLCTRRDFAPIVLGSYSQSVHAIYWCPQTNKNKNGLLLPRSKKGAQLISSGRMFFYASARRCPKCNVIIVEPPEWRLLWKMWPRISATFFSGLPVCEWTGKPLYG